MYPCRCLHALTVLRASQHAAGIPRRHCLLFAVLLGFARRQSFQLIASLRVLMRQRPVSHANCAVANISTMYSLVIQGDLANCSVANISTMYFLLIQGVLENIFQLRGQLAYSEIK